MSRRIFCFALSAMLFALCLPAEAQQSAKIPTIGYLGAGYRSSSLTDAFRQGLRELGYVEGKNILTEYRYAEGKPELLPDLAAELVRLQVNVIVATVTPAAMAAKKATQTIPIITVTTADPVGSRLVASLAHPGGNVTGLSNQLSDVGRKQLEILHEAFPKVSRVAVLWDPTNVANALWLGEVKAAAGPLRITLQLLEVHVSNDRNRIRGY